MIIAQNNCDNSFNNFDNDTDKMDIVSYDKKNIFFAEKNTDMLVILLDFDFIFHA